MLTEERFAKILSILESMGSVTVQQLMTELNASESTICILYTSPSPRD